MYRGQLNYIVLDPFTTLQGMVHLLWNSYEEAAKFRLHQNHVSNYLKEQMKHILSPKSAHFEPHIGTTIFLLGRFDSKNFQEFGNNILHDLIDGHTMSALIMIRQACCRSRGPFQWMHIIPTTPKFQMNRASDM